ncbi:MAG TPA: hypothetical protein VJC17_04220 [Candidatus Dojkabacteria bacterium]|nr:hypothetical protein [Candidatus Dojkabacteria bacterium]
MYVLGYYVIQFTRFVGVAILFVFPLPGWLILSALDIWDYGVSLRAGIDFKKYQYFDKSLDLWFNLFMLLSAWYYQWPHSSVFLFLFLLRFLGELFLLITHKRIYLLYFPNIIHFFFPLYIIYLYLLQDKFNNNLVLLVLLVVATLIKLFEEYQLHYKNYIDGNSAKYLKNSKANNLRKIN